MSIYLELFVNNLSESKSFYNFIGLEIIKETDHRVHFKDENFVLMLALEDMLESNHYFKLDKHSRKGIGVEIVITFENIEEIYNKVKARYPDLIESKLMEREWGMTDFRIIDPDGYYLRISSI